MIYLNKDQQDFIKTINYDLVRVRNHDECQILKDYIQEQKIDISHFMAYNFTFSEILLYMQGKINYREMFCFCGNKGIFRFQLKNNRLEIIGKYCSFECRSSDKKYCDKISDIKTNLYSNPDWKEKTEKKKIDTCYEHHGVAYPMQNIDIFNKHQKACFKKTKRLAGYEEQVLEILEKLFQYENIIQGSKYLKDKNLKIQWQDDKEKNRYSYPDFFIPALNTFIEVKSEYTRKLGDYKIKKCAEKLEQMGFAYIVCVYKKLKKNKEAFAYEILNNPELITED